MRKQGEKDRQKEGAGRERDLDARRFYFIVTALFRFNQTAYGGPSILSQYGLMLIIGSSSGLSSRRCLLTLFFPAQQLAFSPLSLHHLTRYKNQPQLSGPVHIDTWWEGGWGGGADEVFNQIHAKMYAFDSGSDAHHRTTLHRYGSFCADTLFFFFY